LSIKQNSSLQIWNRGDITSRGKATLYRDQLITQEIEK